MERNPTISNIIEYKRTAAKAKRLIKTTKKNTWRKFCSSLTPDTPPQQIWNMIKSMTGISPRRDQPLVTNGHQVTDPTEKAELIAENLDNILGTEPNAISEPEKGRIAEAKSDIRATDFNTRFTPKELKESIQSLPSNKATGEDDT